MAMLIVGQEKPSAEDKKPTLRSTRYCSPTPVPVLFVLQKSLGLISQHAYLHPREALSLSSCVRYHDVPEDPK
jgi:hypothetical protein